MDIKLSDPGDKRITDVGQAHEQALLVESLVSVEHVGLPSPDAHAVASLDAADREVLLATINECFATLSTEQLRVTAEAYLALVRMNTTPYTALLTFPAGDLDVPGTGPKWQVPNAKGEERWHDLTDVVDCEDPNCTVVAGERADVACVVLVSEAWSEGFAHFRDSEYVDVRIPAVTR